MIDDSPVLFEPHNKSLRLEEFRLRLDEFRNAETTAEHLGSPPALKKGNEPRKMSPSQQNEAEDKNISDANNSGANDAMEAFQGGLNLIRDVQVMLSLKRLPIGLELFLAAIRSVRLIYRLSKSPKSHPIPQKHV